MGPAFGARWALPFRIRWHSRWALPSVQDGQRCGVNGLLDSMQLICLALDGYLCLGCLANHQQTGELVMIWRWLIPAMIGAACLVVSLASLLVRWFLRKATSRDIIPQRTREVQVHLARKEAVKMVATSDTCAMVHYQTEGKNKGQIAE